MTPDDERWTADQIKEFIGAILTEKDRAVSMADDEREKAASALRSEQQRREDQATAERSAAAENLRIEMARSIKEGDERLREHIANQIMQIKSALDSADKLELERLARAEDGLEALAVKLDVIRETSGLAQEKFEATAERDKAKQNEFRGALDDLSQTMATRRDMEDRDGALGARIDENQRQLGELRSRLDVGPAGLSSLRSRVDTSSGEQAGAREQRTSSQSSAAGIYALASVVVGVLGLILAAYVATH